MKKWLAKNKIEILTSTLVVGFLCLALGIIMAQASRPADPSSLGQYVSGTSTAIVNGGWATDDNIYLTATSTGGSSADKLILYYELLAAGDSFTTATSAPASFCDQSTAYNSCSNKIWANATNTPNWFDYDYKYRLPITIQASQVKGALANFPVYFDLSKLGPSNNFWSHTKKNSDGGDLAITSSNGTTRAALEIVSISTSTKQGEIYFLADSISSSSNITFYLYYGSSTAAQPASTTATIGSQNVWDANYQGVWHLPNGTVLSAKDFTANGKNGTVSDALAGTGRLNGAANLDGDNDYINLNSQVIPTSGAFTVSAWANFDTITAASGIFQAYINTTSGGRFFFGPLATGYVRLRIGGGFIDVPSPDSLSTGTWYLLTATRDQNDEVAIYLDGNLKATSTNSNSTDAVNTYLGIRAFDLTQDVDGLIDEARISNSARSAKWIGTEYNNQNDPAAFFSTSSEEYNLTISEKAVNITSVPDSSTGYKWQVFAYNLADGKSSGWKVFNETTPNFKVDATAPTAPGALTPLASTTSSIKLQFGSASTENNFAEYKIFYRLGSTTAPTENDFSFSSSSDANLGSRTFNGKSSTTISELTAGTWYSFAIFAYDESGQKASSSYVFERTDRAPTGVLNSAAAKVDTSGTVDVSFTVDDADRDSELRAKIEYVAGGACNFSSPLKPTLDLTDEKTTATKGDPKVDNSEIYQIGSSTGWIDASSSAVTVNFDWLSKTDLGNATGTYCLRLTVDDNRGGQSAYATTTVYIDSVSPTNPGSLSSNKVRPTSVVLNFGAPTDEDSFYQYKIYYKIGASGAAESDTEFSSSTNPGDGNLGFINYNGAATTTIPDLAQGTTYVFNIWAYDLYGQKASATAEFSTTTRNLPINPISLGQYKDDGTTVIPNGYLLNENSIKLFATSTDADNELVTIYYQLATTSGTFLTATSVPSGACSSGTAYNSCPSRVWFSSGATKAGISSLPDSAAGYKWQALACDGLYCSEWVANATAPNFKIDTAAPTAPGKLTPTASTTFSIELQFGSPSVDENFDEYKIFYTVGSTTPISESDFLFSSTSDSNLASRTFNGASITTISGLTLDTWYSFALYAYDSAGHKSSSTISIEKTRQVDIAGFEFAAQRHDRSGFVEVSILAGNDNETDVRARIEYDAGESCTFVAHNKMTIDEADDNTTAVYGDPLVDADEIYPIGTSTEGIITSSGVNTVNFIWPSKTDLPSADGVYCLKVFVNDFSSDIASAIATTTLDNVAPLGLGSLSFSKKTHDSLTLAFGSSVTETNFDEYRIYFKAGSSGVNETNKLFASTSEISDINLGSKNYNGAATTTITGLGEGIQYVFNIWAYDTFGNKASATSELVATANNLPAGSFTAAAEKANGSGVVDISFLAQDADGDNSSRAKLEYVLGSACNFASPLDPTLDETDYNATSTYGDVKIENDNSYQAGTAAGWILTSSGANTVNLDWLSSLDLPGVEDTYCLRLTVNDGYENATSATTTLMVDNKKPSNPGPLNFNKKTSASLVLNFGSQAVEGNFKEYKIFYRQGTGEVTEADTPHIDSNLGYQDYNAKATTTISGLSNGTEYSFKIFAYDDYGYKSSSTQSSFITNKRPFGSFNSIAQHVDGSGIVDVSIEVSDDDGDPVKAKLEYVSGATCDFTSPLDPTLDETDGNITADYGDPEINNSNPYQIGLIADWIVTAYGANTVNFDWFSKTDIGNATGTYCLRLTVNDNMDNQLVLATTTLTIDNAAPSRPGNLTDYKVVGNRVTLLFGSASADDNFDEYKIFYKEGFSGITENDTAFTQNNDINLGDVNYNGKATTTIISLLQSSNYFFNIWAYDVYGNKASGTVEAATTTLVSPAATWREAEDITDPTAGTYLGKEENVRVRISVTNISPFADPGYEYKIQYSPKTAACSAITSWADLPVSTTTGPFEMVDSNNFNNQEATVKRFTDLEDYIFVHGYMVKAPSNKTVAIVLKKDDYTEIEYAFWATANSTAGGTYCFRLLSDNQVLHQYDQYPELTLAPPPTGSFSSAGQRKDGLNIAAIAIKIFDYNGDLSRAKLEYATNSACNFSFPQDPTLDETDADITAVYGDPDIHNNEAYQIGSTTDVAIVTAYGTNTVSFLWPLDSDLTGVDETYCLRLTANDGYDDQNPLATTTFVIDQINPTAPGNLTEYSKSVGQITLSFGATSSDTNFKEYRIYYKEGSSGVTENDSLWSSSSDPNLGAANLNGATTTTITGLVNNKEYVFRIFAYDEYGHKSFSSGETVVGLWNEKFSGDWRWYNDQENETPLSAAAAVNTAPASVSAGNILKLRMAFKERTCVLDDNNIKLRLQYSTYSDFSSDVYWLGEIGSSSIWTYGNGVDYDDAPISTLLLATTTVKMGHNESGISTSTLDQAACSWGEWEFTVRNNDAATGTIYYFRGYNVNISQTIEPSSAGSYPSLIAGASSLSLAVSGVASGVTTEGVTTNASTTGASVPFGLLMPNTDAVGAQRFTIGTNAESGYKLYVYQRSDFISSAGAIMNPVSAVNESPAAWPITPNPSIFGYHTGDSTLSGAAPSRFAAANTYAKLETDMKEVSYSSIPVSNEIFDLIFRAKISELQPHGDFSTNIVYILVPTF